MRSPLLRFWSPNIKESELSHSPGILRFINFCVRIIDRILKGPHYWRLVAQNIEFIGVSSTMIVVLAGIMIGAVFSIQFGQIFRLFGAESMVGAAAAFALSKELAPVVGAILVTGRAGSAMAAEIATMKVNEQIDALRIMSVHPIAYLCVPRVLAAIFVMPFLSAIFLFVGVISAFLLSVMLFNIDVGIFFEKIKWISTTDDLLEGFQKAAIFGAIFSTIGCYMGFYAQGGAKAVGRQTTQAVVASIVLIIVADFIISYIKLRSRSF